MRLRIKLEKGFHHFIDEIYKAVIKKAYYGTAGLKADNRENDPSYDVIVVKSFGYDGSYEVLAKRDIGDINYALDYKSRLERILRRLAGR